MGKYAKKLKWYWNRLRIMGPAEIAFRVRQQIKKLRWQVLLPVLSRPVKLQSKLVPGSEHIKEPRFWIDLDRREEIWDAAAEFIEATVAKADKLLEHKFTFFGLQDEWFGDNIQWNRDYTTGVTVPMTYSMRLDMRNEKLFGNNKGTWEHNRHNYLVTLARAFYLTGNEKYAREAVNQIEEWICTNPYLHGPNWTSSLESGIRLISWSWAYYLLKGSTHRTESFRNTLLASVWRHCNFIRHFTSRYSSANNHLIGEVAGLFVGATLFPELRESRSWQRFAYDILVREIEKQIYPDGVCKEQGISYACFDIDFFVLCGLLGERNAISFPQAYWDRIERMIEFLAAITDCKGHVPQIGDCDDGRAILLSETDDYYGAFLGLGACLFDRGDLKAKAGKFQEKALWLLGPEARERFDALEPPTEPTFPRSFEEGGYYVLGCGSSESDEVKILFDCGELSYLEIAAHGHADCLAFTLSAFGNEILVDPGTYAYHTMLPWRRYFKGTIGHNTVRVDGEDQSVYAGWFLWTDKARPNLMKYESTDSKDRVVGSHDGYTRLADPVTQMRDITFDKNSFELVVRDAISASGTHHIELPFHFAPGCRVTRNGDREIVVHNGETEVLMSIDNKCEVEISHGSDDPIVGWFSSQLDVKIPAYSVVVSARTHGDAEFTTKIRIRRKVVDADGD